VVVLLLHFYKRVWFYAGAVVIGVVAGYFLNDFLEDEYAANMYIETNFNSSRQAYEVISEFNQLAAVDMDTVELSKRLKITPSEASSLRAFYIQADKDETELMKDFIRYKGELDSITRIDASFKEYKKTRNEYNFKTHKVGIAATDKFVFKKLNEGLINEFLDNEYINKLKEATLKNLDNREVAINQEIRALDSLKKTYLEIRKRESEKEFSSSQGTNFYMSGVEKTELIKDETQIVNKIYSLENEKQGLALARVQNQNQINVISEFPNTGYNITEWHDNKILILPTVLVLMTLFIFMFLGLGKFLKEKDV
jgi:hypothetical protein